MKNYYPVRRQIIMCNFDKKCEKIDCDSKCFKPPEMIKVRPVLVVSGINRGQGLITVLPLSTTIPTTIEKWHYHLDKKHLPTAKFFHKTDCWVKADMIYTVAITRTWLIKEKDNKFFRKKLPFEVFNEIKKCMFSIFE